MGDGQLLTRRDPLVDEACRARVHDGRCELSGLAAILTSCKIPYIQYAKMMEGVWLPQR